MSAYPVYSTSVETVPIKRVNRVMGRSVVNKYISRGEVYNCRTVAGSSTYSQHSWGNAVDLYPKTVKGMSVAEVCAAIAKNAVGQASHATPGNYGRKVAVSQVIDHVNDRIWEPSTGWRPYGGEATAAHVHISGAPYRTGVPPCA